MSRYNPKEIEPKWQAKWLDDKIYEVDFNSNKPKFVGFAMFNYPSGAGIHVGHVRNFTIPDVVTRVKRQQGFESYQPVGWDSFGLPAENYAIKTGVAPQESIKQAIKTYHTQYRAMGWAMDWSKEIDTTEPEYYRWTQWCFSKLFENELAYQKESPQWWCDQCKTVLADEQVIAGKCWRHDGPDDPLVTKRNLRQWFFKITDYADEMLEATDDLDWTQSVKSSQKSWIGRSVGAEIKFAIFEADAHSSSKHKEDSKHGMSGTKTYSEASTGDSDVVIAESDGGVSGSASKQDGASISVRVFTTRPDTIFGATFLVLAPEHELVEHITTDEQKAEVDKYVARTMRKSELERQEGKEKTGVFTGAYAINPANGEKIPIWIADYVLTGYGTGAIMAVPAHDERDNEFAKKFELPIVRVIKNDASDDKCSHDEGVMINSGEYDGMASNEAREKIVADLTEKGVAQEKVNYKMRDWLISRQRYWGAPIPIIHCPECGPVAVPEKDLPVVLPEVKDYQPTGDNVSVLAGVTDWVNTTCPKCGGAGKRETDTMDGYVCSSWYFLRYMDPTNGEKAWDEAQANKWMPVDFYNGGDHATAHLLYARFFNRFFHKLGYIDSKEPFKKMLYHGKIKAHDGSAFSKSKGNGVDPLTVIEQGYGADAIRVYQMFAAPLELDILWDEQGIPGAYRFLNRVWTLIQEYLESGDSEISKETEDEILRATNQAIKKVTEDIEGLRFNTAIAGLMELTNALYKIKAGHPISKDDTWKEVIESLLMLLAPFAPHITEELWHQIGNTDSIHVDHWPDWDNKYLVSDSMNIVVQINGKLRANIEVASNASKDEIIEQAQQDEKVASYLTGNFVKKSIYVPNKLVNFVI